MRTNRSHLAKILGPLALLALAGCAGVPPSNVATNRMDYGQAIAESWKQQTLTNVVRLRYADAPVFLDVAAVINSSSVGGKMTGSLQLPERTLPNVLQFGGEGSWSNTPTVTYQPLLGDRFTRSMLQPVPPAAVFQLLQGGWPADLVLNTVVTSINGLRNESSGMRADDGYNELVATMSRIQRAGALAIRVEPRKEGSAIVMVMRQEGASSALLDDARRVRELLRVGEGVGEFEIAFGLLPRSRTEVAVITRSMLELLLQLGFGIEIPRTHVAQGRVLPGRHQADEPKARGLVRIRSGTTAPADAYVAVPYKDHWYWIDDDDIASKRIFTFLLILSSLAETGQGQITPVVTVPSR